MHKEKPKRNGSYKGYAAEKYRNVYPRGDEN
jgi:hypothetical protein